MFIGQQTIDFRRGKDKKPRKKRGVGKAIGQAVKDTRTAVGVGRKTAGFTKKGIDTRKDNKFGSTNKTAAKAGLGAAKQSFGGSKTGQAIGKAKKKLGAVAKRVGGNIKAAAAKNPIVAGAVVGATARGAFEGAKLLNKKRKKKSNK